jgi:hypothetical protein
MEREFQAHFPAGVCAHSAKTFLPGFVRVNEHKGLIGFVLDKVDPNGFCHCFDGSGIWLLWEFSVHERESILQL